MELPSAEDLENAQKLLAWLEQRVGLLQGVMDGTHQIVPVQPTEEMVNYGYYALRTENVIDSSEQGRVKRIYKAMLERIPQC